MKLKKGFVTYQLGGEQMMVAAGAAAKQFHGMVRSNETAAFIVDCLKKETTQDAIVDAILARSEGVERERAARDVAAIVEKLQSIGALE